METQSIVPVMHRLFPEGLKGNGEKQERRTIPLSDMISSRAAAGKVGASLRQLQWWDEKGLVCPVHCLKKRWYSAADIAALRVIVRLRKVGYSLHAIRRLLKSAAFQTGAYRYILTDGRRSQHATNSEDVLRLMLAAKTPLTLIDRGPAC